jgi:hypothetical protein
MKLLVSIKRTLHMHENPLLLQKCNSSRTILRLSRVVCVLTRSTSRRLGSPGSPGSSQTPRIQNPPSGLYPYPRTCINHSTGSGFDCSLQKSEHTFLYPDSRFPAPEDTEICTHIRRTGGLRIPAVKEVGLGTFNSGLRFIDA